MMAALTPPELAERIKGDAEAMLFTIYTRDADITRLEADYAELKKPKPPDTGTTPGGGVQPDLDDDWLPFSIAPPVNPAIIDDIVGDFRSIVGPGDSFSDRIYRNCHFIGTRSTWHPNGSVTWGHSGYEILAHQGAPRVERVRFENCTFETFDRYSFWCDGILRDVEFVNCVFLTSSHESASRIYNWQRGKYTRCRFYNIGKRKWASRKMRTDLIAFDECQWNEADRRGGTLTFNQSDSGAWIGRHWLRNCDLYRGPEADHKVIAFGDIHQPPNDLQEIDGHPIEIRIHLEDVRTHGGDVQVFRSYEQYVTRHGGCTHNGVALE